MIIKCPECHKDVSDSALLCPSCGFRVAAAIKDKLTQASLNYFRRDKILYGDDSNFGDRIKAIYNTYVSDEEIKQIVRLEKEDIHLKLTKPKLWKEKHYNDRWKFGNYEKWCKENPAEAKEEQEQVRRKTASKDVQLFHLALRRWEFHKKQSFFRPFDPRWGCRSTMDDFEQHYDQEIESLFAKKSICGVSKYEFEYCNDKYWYFISEGSQCVSLLQVCEHLARWVQRCLVGGID